MATVKHTPGPWTDGREGSGDFISPAVVVLGDTGECSKCGGGPGEIIIKPADKRLVKAAPELADSLKALRSWVMQHPRASLWTEQERDMLTDATNALEKAGRLL